MAFLGKKASQDPPRLPMQKQAYEVYVDENGYAHDDEGNAWYVGEEYAGGTYGLRDLPRAVTPRYAPKYTPRPEKRDPVLEQLAEVAYLSKDTKGSDFLRQMARARYAPTEKQRAYIESLRKRYEHKIPMIHQLREKAQRELEEARKQEEAAERQKEQEERELLALGREMRREGWEEAERYFGGVSQWTYKEPPYEANLYVKLTQYENVAGWTLSVKKDETNLYSGPMIQDLEKAKDLAHGLIERDKRKEQQKAPEPPPTPPSTPAAPAETPAEKKQLIERLQALSDAARSDDPRLSGALRGWIAQLKGGKEWSEFSDKQRAWAERSFPKYKVAVVVYRFLQQAEGR